MEKDKELEENNKRRRKREIGKQRRKNLGKNLLIEYNY